MKHEHCKHCGACDNCDRCDHCGHCRKCGKFVAVPYTFYIYPPIWYTTPITTIPVPYITINGSTNGVTFPSINNVTSYNTGYTV